MHQKFFLFFMALFLLSGCQMIAVEVKSQNSVPGAFRYAPEKGSVQEITRWWTVWHKPELNQLIEQGLKGNFTVAAAHQRMQAARAFADVAQGELLPQAGVSAALGHHDMNLENPLQAMPALVPLLGGTPLSGKDVSGKDHFAHLSASWEVDVFGKKTADADALKQQSLSAEELYHGAQTAVAAQIADVYFAMSAVDARRALLQQSITALKEMQRYTQGRFRAGQASRYETDKLSARLGNLQAQQEPLNAQRVRYEQQLAVLSGQSPQTFRLPESLSVADNLPPLPIGVIPSDVLARRPDVRARVAAVQSAAAKLASAKADLLPRFYLNFIFQDGRIGIGSLPDLSGTGSLISAGVKLPIFTAGRIRANIRGQDALLNAALAEYDHTLLNALQEVDSSYRLRRALDQNISELQRATEIMQQRAVNSRYFFEKGYLTYGDVLNAQLDALKSQDDLMMARYHGERATISLYQALGGGWQVHGE